MAQNLPTSEGARSAPRMRDGGKRKAPTLFRVLFKAFEVLGLILEVINGFRDLF